MECHFQKFVLLNFGSREFCNMTKRLKFAIGFWLWNLLIHFKSSIDAIHIKVHGEKPKGETADSVIPRFHGFWVIPDDSIVWNQLFSSCSEWFHRDSQWIQMTPHWFWLISNDSNDFGSSEDSKDSEWFWQFQMIPSDSRWFHCLELIICLLFCVIPCDSILILNDSGWFLIDSD
jgi:hypothetical protein